jgi:hypothetical protein
MPSDFGTHHRWNSAAVVHASYTALGVALINRLTTKSRKELRSAFGRPIKETSWDRSSVFMALVLS